MTGPSLRRSRRLGALVGPSVMAIIASEFPLVQPHLYDEQSPPVVYLSGVLAFVAGLAIVRAHHRWVRGWPVLLTLVGYAGVALGLVRMFAAGGYRAAAGQASQGFFIGLEVVLFVVGLVITVQAYRPHRRVKVPAR